MVETLRIALRFLLLVFTSLNAAAVGPCVGNAFGLECDPADGHFRAEQCSSLETTLQCWCVNPVTGLEIVNTRTTKAVAERQCRYPEGVAVMLLQVRSNATFKSVYKRASAAETQSLFARFVSAFGTYLYRVRADQLDGIALSYSLASMMGYGGRTEGGNHSSKMRPGERLRDRQTEMKLVVGVLGHSGTLGIDWLASLFNDLITRGTALPLTESLLLRRVRVLPNENRTLAPAKFQELPLDSRSDAAGSPRPLTGAYPSASAAPCRRDNESTAAYVDAACEESSSDSDADDTPDTDEYGSDSIERSRRNQESLNSATNAHLSGLSDWLKVIEHPAFVAIAICLMLVVALLTILASLYCVRQTHCSLHKDAQPAGAGADECAANNRMWCPIKNMPDYYGAPRKVDQEFFA